MQSKRFRWFFCALEAFFLLFDRSKVSWEKTEKKWSSQPLAQPKSGKRFQRAEKPTLRRDADHGWHCLPRLSCCTCDSNRANLSSSADLDPMNWAKRVGSLFFLRPLQAGSRITFLTEKNCLKPFTLKSIQRCSLLHYRDDWLYYSFLLFLDLAFSTWMAWYWNHTNIIVL